MFIEFEAIKFLLAAFGPLVIFAWVFEQTRPAAWTALKLLIQSALIIILTSAMVSMIGRSFSNIVPDSILEEVGDTYEISTANMQIFLNQDSYGTTVILLIVVFVLFAILKGAALFIVFGAGSGSVRKMVGGQ